MDETLSIKKAMEDREDLEQKAQAIWESMAKRLEALIPASMKVFAEESSWIDSTIAGQRYWLLPDFLGWLVKNTRNGGCNENKFRAGELEDYGFEDFADLEAQFKKLAKAWKGLVRIKVDKSELPHRVVVRFYAAEIVPASKAR